MQTLDEVHMLSLGWGWVNGSARQEQTPRAEGSERLNRNAGAKSASPKTLAIGGAGRDGNWKLSFVGLYMRADIALNDGMSLGELVVMTLGGLLLVVASIRLARNFFSEDAKRERRRRRSNSPIAAKSNRPMVKFSVKTKKDQRK